MTIDTFLENWVKNTETLEYCSRRLYNDIMEVHLSKSGRTNTLRINAIKSRECEKGHATKFIKWLIRQANQHNFNLTTCAQPWGHSFESIPSKEVVRDLFLKHGFKIKWQYPDEKGWEMARELKR